MITQSEIWQGKVEALGSRLGFLEQRVGLLEEYNTTRDRPIPSSIKDDFAALCKGINIAPALLLSKRDDGFRTKRKAIVIQLVRRGWSQAAVAALFDRDVRSIRRLTLKNTWKEKQ
jgi:hypothetical protein